MTTNESSLKSYQYNLDRVDAELIAGWAKNIQKPNHKPIVSVYSNGVHLWSVVADLPRDDLMQNEIGNFAFHLEPVVEHLSADITHVDVLIDDQKVNSEPLPLVLKADKTDGVVDAEESKIHCFIDDIGPDSVKGWAKLAKDDSKTVLVEFKHGDVVLASGMADQYRQDLFDSGIGNGKYAYSLSYHLTAFPSNPVEAQVYVEGVLLPNDPVTFHVSDRAIETARFDEKYGKEIECFNASVQEKMKAFESLITEQSAKSGEGASGHMNVAMNVALQQLAELSTRVEVIEKILTRHFDADNTPGSD